MTPVDTGALSMCAVAALVVERSLEAVGEVVWALVKEWTGFEPSANLKRLLYIVLASACGWATGINAFPVFAVYPLTGRILTALLIGAGAQGVHALIKALEGNAGS
jgi:hypothetical protein